MDNIHRVDTPEKVLIHIPGQTKQESKRFHQSLEWYTIYNSELVISLTYYLIFLHTPVHKQLKPCKVKPQARENYCTATATVSLF